MISEVIANTADELGLGAMLGRREAFGTVAGRCSAAEADCLRRIRQEKLYRAKAAHWRVFCRKYLGMSKTQVDTFIRLLEDFGPDYFEVAQFTRVSPQAYRAIASSVKDKAIHVNGEAIALIPENAGRVAAAVTELRRAAAKESPRQVPGSGVASLERRSDQLVRAFNEFAQTPPDDPERHLLGAVLTKTQTALERIRLELGL